MFAQGQQMDKMELRQHNHHFSRDYTCLFSSNQVQLRCRSVLKAGRDVLNLNTQSRLIRVMFDRFTGFSDTRHLPQVPTIKSTMAGARVVVVLALASLLVAQAAQTRPSFVEWIKQGPGKVQSAYEEVETETTCLQSLEVNNCQCHTPAGGDPAPHCNIKYYE